APADCITFYSRKDIEKLEKFMQGKPIAEQEIGRQLLGETMAYAESNTCRRKLLLNYFGETYNVDNCGCCDNCINPKKTFEGSSEMLSILRLIDSLPEHFKSDHIAGILAGVSNSLIKSYRHDKLGMFGCGKEHSQNLWATLIYQGVLLKFIHKEIETYGLLSVTPKGRQFMEEPYPLMLQGDRKFSEVESDEDDDDALGQMPRSGSGGGGDLTLLAMLKDLRKDISRKMGVQWWAVFSDASLEDMSISYPVSIEDLKKCQGVGDGKARKFGKTFIEVISKYVEENEIVRPDDFRIKTPDTTKVDKVAIMHLVDRKLSLDEIARDMGMDMDELLGKLESIVYSGTRSDLTSAIEQMLDPAIVDERWDYFQNEAVDDSMARAREALGDEYEEIEIRLVRLKFICEVAN
ncbi:MAG: RecQ family zinc-binding domain-containing protein, partial [Bacteroidales bacterium]|nr:RecQ family zinc-binding domain-containing protein [Bacteroidales bacterium]